MPANESIYFPKNIKELRAFYGDLLFEPERSVSIKNHLQDIAVRLHQGLEQKLDFLFVEVNNYHKGYLGQAIETLKSANDLESMAFTTIANEHGFMSWKEVEELGTSKYNGNFEQVVNSMLEGDYERFKELLKSNPDLIFGKSKYGHEATLLHYMCSNGVEFWRQIVPFNLPKMMKLLLESGGNPIATMNVYNGHFEPIELLTTGAHPYAAGIGKELEEVLNHFLEL